MMKVYPSDWLMNAGIVGYLRLCEKAGKNVDTSRGYVQIDASDLEEFTESYFTAVLMRVARGTFRLRSDIFADLKTRLEDANQFRQIRAKFGELEYSAFAKIKSDYRDFEVSRKSVIKAIEYFEEQLLKLCDKELAKFPEVERKDILKMKAKLKEQIAEGKKKLGDKNLNFVYVYLQKFYRNKNIIGNPAIGKTGRKKAFYTEYVKAAAEQLSSKKVSSEGFLCRFCKENRVQPESFYDVNSIFAEGMFSTTAITISFRNFFYNMQPDMFVCNVCELLLMCAWYGFTEIPYRFQDEINDTEYIFVSVPTLELLYAENKKIEDIYHTSEEKVQGTVYQDIIQDIFLREKKTKARWALANILFVEIKTTPRKDVERPNFRYFHIGRDIAELFMDEHAIKAFQFINGKVEVANNLEVNLRRNVVTRILDHNSLYPLCHALVASYLERREQFALRNVFNILLLSCIREHITTKTRGEKPMLESAQIYGILKHIQDEGNSFAANIDYEVRKRKSYILLSMIRNNRVEDFYDILMKLYISENKPVPDSLISLLNIKDEIGFQARAYAFVSGFLADKNQAAKINNT